MAPATINSAVYPATELSPVTIAVRDKIIEKFTDLPLEDMNESVKRLLTQEKDEQSVLVFWRRGFHFTPTDRQAG